MITWHPHTEAPIGESVVAVIAAKATADGHRYIMPEQYRYSATEGEWIGERTGLLLRPAEFDWLNETDLLTTIPEVGAGGTDELDGLKVTVIQLLEILRQWKPDCLSAAERNQIILAMCQVGILSPPTRISAIPEVGAGGTAEVQP